MSTTSTTTSSSNFELLGNNHPFFYFYFVLLPRYFPVLDLEFPTKFWIHDGPLASNHNFRLRQLESFKLVRSVVYFKIDISSSSFVGGVALTILRKWSRIKLFSLLNDEVHPISWLYFGMFRNGLHHLEVIPLSISQTSRFQKLRHKMNLLFILLTLIIPFD